MKLLNRCEFVRPKKHSGGNEFIVAVVACFIWFVAVALKLSIQDQNDWSALEKIVEASSIVMFCGFPVFFLATPLGSKVAENILLKKDGLWFQLSVCLTLIAYISLVRFLGFNSDKFLWLDQMNNLVIRDHFLINTMLFTIGVFVALRTPFLMLRLRKNNLEIKESKKLIRIFNQNLELLVLLVINFVYMVLSHTSLSNNFGSNHYEGYYVGTGYFLIFALMLLSISKKTSFNKVTLFDFLLIIICASILFWFSVPFFSFGTFMGVNLFVVVVVHGTGLGREHFGYSFQIRKQDVKYLVSNLPLVTLVLGSLALFLGFVKLPNLFESNLEILKLVSYSILFSFRVGIFEEIFFRSGLMVLIRDQLYESITENNSQKIVFYSALGCSFLFGLSHIGNNPGTESLLTPLEYKSVYFLLAVLASLFYSFAFAETNRLWCSIMIHGFVDTVAVVLLGSSLTVPF